MTLAQAFVAAIAEDSTALAELRVVLGVAAPVMADTGPLAYTVASLAKELGVSAKVVRGAIQRGELEAVKRGNRWLIAAEAVRAWLSGERSKATRPRRTGSMRRARAGEPSLRAVLCNAPADTRIHKSRKGE